ncbi:MAG: pilus assembly protein PilM [Candidatus Eisenbacteria sp.]|nr:pilus assembly protein PilM [Candidatus Eisenbacteria bacterium]
MFGSGKIRTGIDLGTGSVKIVRIKGIDQSATITHAGFEPWPQAEESADLAEPAAVALSRLLARFGLRKNSLGRIAVAVSGEETSLREVFLPPLSDAEMRMALPFEARRHLNLEDMSSPQLDFQILGPAPRSEEEDQEQVRVLLAAVPRQVRDFPVRVLARLGLEPEVVDLEPLAGLNALMAHQNGELEAKRVVGLLDLGRRRACLHVTGCNGGFLSRTVGPGHPGEDAGERVAAYRERLTERIRETLTYYRGRFRQEVAQIHLAGGGSLLRDLASDLREALERPVAVLDPLTHRLAKTRGAAEVEGMGSRFVVAWGLCQWWNRGDV